MKEKDLLYRVDLCRTHLEDPTLKTLRNAQARGPELCRYYTDRTRCSAPPFRCVRLTALQVVRNILAFYSEATEQTLAMELDVFRRTAPLPPHGVKAYIDGAEFDYRPITDAELVVQRVSECARQLLDLSPGEKIFRSSEELVSLIG
jgi:hypothetical protein